MSVKVGFDGKVLTVADDDPRVPPALIISLSLVFAPRDFVALFTAAEQQALFSSDQWQVKMFISVALAGPVDLSNAEVIADLGACVALGILTADRVQTILAGQSLT